MLKLQNVMLYCICLVNFNKEFYYEKRKEKKKTESKAARVIGGLIIGTAAIFFIPKVIDESSNFIFKKKPSRVNNDNEWGEDPIKKN